MSIRADVADRAVLPESLTVRSLTEWYKNNIDSSLDAEHRQYVDSVWVAGVTALAEREQVPAGWLSYVISELAISERNLALTAQQEAQLDG